MVGGSAAMIESATIAVDPATGVLEAAGVVSAEVEATEVVSAEVDPATGVVEAVEAAPAAAAMGVAARYRAKFRAYLLRQWRHPPILKRQLEQPARVPRRGSRVALSASHCALLRAATANRAALAASLLLGAMCAAE